MYCIGLWVSQKRQPYIADKYPSNLIKICSTGNIEERRVLSKSVSSWKVIEILVYEFSRKMLVTGWEFCCESKSWVQLTLCTLRAYSLNVVYLPLKE